MALKRSKLSKSQFGLPGKRKYPIPDKEHAANAKGRAKRRLKKGKLSRSAYKKIVARATEYSKPAKERQAQLTTATCKPCLEIIAALLTAVIKSRQTTATDSSITGTVEMPRRTRHWFADRSVGNDKCVNYNGGMTNMVAMAGTGYGLIGILVIILLVVLIFYFVRRA